MNGEIQAANFKIISGFKYISVHCGICGIAVSVLPYNDINKTSGAQDSIETKFERLEAKVDQIIRELNGRN